jgi:V8-like Glu-specific endopeptidase
VETHVPSTKWTSFHTNLRNVLAHYFRSQADSDALLIEAGLDPVDFEANPKAITRWTFLITEADIRRKLPALIDAALARYPDDDYLLAAKRGDLTGVSGPDVETKVTWQGPADGAQLEKIIGKASTLLHVAFLERGMQVARAVVRVAFPEGSGTGFVVKGVQGPIVITNNHVLPDVERARAARIQFNYQLTVDQLDAQVVETGLNVEGERAFATSTQHDWSAVRLVDLPSNVTPLELAPRTLQKGDPVNIIQHPAGGPKQIALYHNVIVYVDDTLVQYLTDTKPGSSGAPGFDSAWQVISLHHSGGWLAEPGSKETAWRNEGIHVNTVIRGLTEAGMM